MNGTLLMGHPALAAIIGPTLDWVAGLLVASAIIAATWRWIVSGAKKLVSFNDDVAPNMQYMPLLPKVDKILDVVEDLAGQVKRDHGSSLRDDMDALREAVVELGQYARENREAAAVAGQAADRAQQAAVEARQAAEKNAQINAAGITKLEVLAGTMKEHAKDAAALARDDRDIARDSIEKTLAKIEMLVQSAQRTEASGERVEASGARTEEAAATVRDELAATQHRASEVDDDEAPGAAADAALRPPEQS